MEIKNCPFCGGKAKLNTFSWDFQYDSFNVDCESCGAESAMHETPEAAITAWNRREGE